MRAAFLLPLGLLGACATTDVVVVDMQTTPAPSFAQVKQEIDTAGTCSGGYNVGSRNSGMMPRALYYCSVTFPPSLQQSEIEGECISIFDLHPEGYPINVESRCTINHRSASIPAEWKDVALEGFVYAANHMIVQTRYLPASDPSMAGKWRENIVVAVSFSVGGGYRQYFAPPRIFPRAPPAAPMTADQIAYYTALDARWQNSFPPTASSN